MTRQRLGAVLLVLAALVAGGGVVSIPLAEHAEAATGEKTFQTTATRVQVDKNGKTTVLDKRSISMTVSQTTNLRGRQMIDVSWSGAHPTGGIVADPNSGQAVNEEFPFVLMQCRGTAASITPETCWTQSSVERFVSDTGNDFPSWRSDAFASDADRARVVGAPAKRPKACGAIYGPERWVAFKGADGTVYPGGPSGCAGIAPEASDINNGGLPSNTTYGITTSDGTGATQFAVWSEDDNASLGCSATVACALVAVPIEGISCDPYGTKVPAKQRPAAWQRKLAVSGCETPALYDAGDGINPGNIANISVTGQLWWSASNWRNRIVVPLSFAVSASECSVVSDLKPLQTYGSVLLSDITAQWEPTFCTSNAYTPFVHVQTSDVSARGLLQSGNVDVAFGTQAVTTSDDDTGPPIVQAPVAMTGFSVSYNIDGSDGKPYTSLRLDARLVAKLLSESYPANALVQNNYDALAGNPLNITLDPEFQALNPGVPKYSVMQAAATIITLSSDSDMMWALTSWIQDDPEAHAFLDGTPDPWGMVVNPSYQGIELPVTSWPLLDDWMLPQDYIDSQANPCYSRSPAPYLALVASPIALMSQLTQDIQFGLSNVGTACVDPDPANIATLRLRSEGRQVPGHRFVIGITPLTSAQRYSFRSAALQTSSDVSPGDKFGDDSGRTFVGADDAGLEGAARLLVADPDTGTWDFPYDQLHTAAGNAAYPGAMVVYADVPTSGVTSSTADQAAELLSYAATKGQVAGTANGELAPGALPLSSATGLGDLAGYTLCAADAVKAQKGEVPSLDQTSGCHAIVPKPRPDAVPSSGPSGGGGGTTNPSGGDGGAITAPGGDVPSGTASGTPGDTATSAQTVLTAGTYSAMGRFGLPTAAVIGLLLAVAGLLLRWGGDAARAARFVLRRRR